MSTGMGICYQRSIGSKGFVACIPEKFSYSLQWVIGAAGRLGNSKSYEAGARTQNSWILSDTNSYP
jgi:hypothetical protein